ncbi:MAG: DNA-binding protein [Nitrospirota bacterium]|nr:DNA-binding protein [Nitrospirota bacterium]
MKRILGVGIVVLGLVIATAAFAQPWQGWKNCGGWCKEDGSGPGAGGPGGMYDPAKAETVKGQVEAVEQISGKGRMGQGIGLKLKTDSGTLSVHLGPKWYIEQQGEVKIAAGDTLEIKGVKTQRWGQDVFIAGEIKRGDDVLKLRDENGVPLWAGWRKGCGNCPGPRKDN